MDIQWNTDSTLTIEPPKHPKKLTGTRFASVMGLNRWNSPFQMWCDITKAVKMPFEETKYTRAGKVIEQKQIAYMREAYGMDDLIDPTQEFGPDYFKTTYGNFFTHKVFGGMWDALQKDGDEVVSVLEFKTTSRPQDWLNDKGEVDPPEYYALQAALYAWLLDCDYVIMVVSFLSGSDYDDPDAYVPSFENTQTYDFYISERYPNFVNDYVKPALAWWDKHVVTGNSPVFDERQDTEYLKLLRNVSLNPDSDIKGMLAELAACQKRINAAEEKVKKDATRAKQLKDQLKQYATETIGDEDTCTIEGNGVICCLSKSTNTNFDEEAMRNDGVFAKYAKETESTRFTVKYTD